MGFHSQKQSWEDYQNEVIDKSEVGPVCHLEFQKRSWKKKNRVIKYSAQNVNSPIFKKPILDKFENHHIFNKIDIFASQKLDKRFYSFELVHIFKKETFSGQSENIWEIKIMLSENVQIRFCRRTV